MSARVTGKGRGSERKVSCFEPTGEPTARMTGLSVEEAEAHGTEGALGHAAVSTAST